MQPRPPTQEEQDRLNQLLYGKTDYTLKQRVAMIDNYVKKARAFGIDISETQYQFMIDEQFEEHRKLNSPINITEDPLHTESTLCRTDRIRQKYQRISKRIFPQPYDRKFDRATRITIDRINNTLGTDAQPQLLNPNNYTTSGRNRGIIFADTVAVLMSAVLYACGPYTLPENTTTFRQFVSHALTILPILPIIATHCIYYSNMQTHLTKLETLADEADEFLREHYS